MLLPGPLAATQVQEVREEILGRRLCGVPPSTRGGPAPPLRASGDVPHSPLWARVSGLGVLLSARSQGLRFMSFVCVVRSDVVVRTAFGGPGSRGRRHGQEDRSTRAPNRVEYSPGPAMKLCCTRVGNRTCTARRWDGQIQSARDTHIAGLQEWQQIGQISEEWVRLEQLPSAGTWYTSVVSFRRVDAPWSAVHHAGCPTCIKVGKFLLHRSSMALSSARSTHMYRQSHPCADTQHELLTSLSSRVLPCSSPPWLPRGLGSALLGSASARHCDGADFEQDPSREGHVSEHQPGERSEIEAGRTSRWGVVKRGG